MKKILIITILFFIFTIGLKAQNTSPTEIQLAEIEECAKLLEKSVEANKAANGLIKNLETEISERKKLQTITDEEIKSLRQTIESLRFIVSEQQKLIQILLKQSKVKVKVCLVC